VEVPLLERYRLLPHGFKLAFQKLGLTLLFVMSVINLLIMHLIKADKRRKYIRITLLLFVFMIGYILLLPLGGYRAYRPFIIRHDTLSPVTTALMFTYGLTTIFVISFLKSTKLKIYSIVMVVMVFIYTNADRYKGHQNECEKKLLYTVSNSSEDIVLIDDWCWVLAWNRTEDYHTTEKPGELLQYWNITKKNKMWYHSDKPW
jgi:hypothetical protein